MYQPREYRAWVKENDLVAYTIRLKETDLYVRTSTDLSSTAFAILKKHRKALESYILLYPFFAASFEPLSVEGNAPGIVKAMAQASFLTGVGPMAAVAGAIAEMIGEELAVFSPEVIIENGGDNYVLSKKERIVAVFAGDSPLSRKVGLRIDPKEMPLGVCTSSGTVGPSISLGRADASVVVARSAALADAAATAIGNVVSEVEDIPRGLDLANEIEGLSGVLIIKNDRMGAWGKIEICRIGDTFSA